MDDDEEAYFNNSDEEDAVPDEGKREDEPPTSDLRRRVKEDDESNSGETASQSFMDTETGPVLASQASLTPPTLLRRKLVDYGDDEDGDDDDGDAFGRLANAKTKTGPSSEPSPPPEKKIRLESGDDSSDDGGSVSDSSDTQRSSGSRSPQKASSPSGDGAGQPIKFKLGNLRNGRSSSPLSSANVKSRSVSPLPPVATRTGIAFVKATAVDGDNQSQRKMNEDSAMTEAAIQLKSEMARDFKRLDSDMEDTSKRMGDAASSHDPIISMQGAIVIPVSPPEEESQVRSASEDPPTPSAVLSE